MNDLQLSNKRDWLEVGMISIVFVLFYIGGFGRTAGSGPDLGRGFQSP